MSHPAGQPAHRFHLLGLGKLRLEFFPPFFRFLVSGDIMYYRMEQRFPLDVDSTAEYHYIPDRAVSQSMPELELSTFQILAFSISALTCSGGRVFMS